MTLAHLGGLPIEETLGMAGPLLLAFGAASARLGARLRVRARPGKTRRP